MSSIMACLKNERTVIYAFVTGINKVPKAGQFCDINNVQEFSILDSEYAEAFGLTEQNVQHLIEIFNRENPETQVAKSDLQEECGNNKIRDTYYFNLLSVINYFERKKNFKSYQINSGHLT